jgi:hypothetical protein
MQRIEVFQSLWAMTWRPANGVEMTLAEQMQKIADAGFDGVDIVYGDHGEEELAALLARHGLACTVTGFPKSVKDLQDPLQLALNLGARHLNIIGQVYPFAIEEGADYLRSWLQMCDRAGMPVTIETHRDCITTDMHYCLQLLDAVPEMNLCADLSHYVVGREFGWPISDQVQSQIETILERSSSFQGRIASREQIQLQISFAHHAEWFDLFAGWWAYGFDSWKKRHEDDAILNFLCELGPREYAMTGADGEELSDRWQEALIIRDRVLQIWNSSSEKQAGGEVQ